MILKKRRNGIGNGIRSLKMEQVATARLLLLEGEVDAGLSLLEEVGVKTMSGDLDPLSTGVVYCELVCALQGVAQYDLAEEWIGSSASRMALSSDSTA